MPLATAAPLQPHPASDEGLQALCDEGGYIPTMPAYAGLAPHPIEGFEPGQNAGTSVSSPILWSDPPDDLHGAFNVSTHDSTGLLTTDYSRIQLVACVTRIGSSPTETVCEDLGGNVKLRTAKYRMTVLETHAGRVVQVIDTGAGTDGCPSYAYVDSINPVVFTGFDGARTYDVLRPLVLWDGQAPRPAAPGATWTGRG